MKSLILLNGSPRGERSNSMKMMTRVAQGWERAGAARPEIYHLARRADFDRAVDAFAGAGVVLLGMPLYTDAMPALVKFYIEALEEPLRLRPEAKPTLAFLVQSGFPEALHSRPLERYLEKLTRRLGASYAGTIVRGGGEALQMMPDEANGELWEELRTLGEQLAKDGRFGEAALRTVARFERFPDQAAADPFFKLMAATGYWDRQLKTNGAWERRCAAPYGPAAQ
jgi:NAD(P)H-dependent FMN reductase